MWYWIPGVGAGYAWANAYLGENAFTGERLSLEQRVNEIAIGAINVEISAVGIYGIQQTFVAFTGFGSSAATLACADADCTNEVQEGYKTFDALKRAIGPTGPGQVWHHLVEQRLAGWRFAPEADMPQFL